MPNGRLNYHLGLKLEIGYKNIFEKISSGKTSKGSYPVQQEKPVKTGKAG